MSQNLARNQIGPCIPFFLLLLVNFGCDASIERFEPNQILAKRFELTESIDMSQPLEDSSELLTELFGTPDQPKWPEFLDDTLVDIERLKRAAGPVRSEESGLDWGLFRKHCVVCHGLTGDGLGPSSVLLNPYPRDFRLGKFKFKSTPVGKKPTRDDLKRVLREGIVGTSMPAFGLLSDEDIEALVDYIIYFSVRGEVERKLLVGAAIELDIDGGERLYHAKLKESDPKEFEEIWELIQKDVEDVASNWLEASDHVLEVPEPTRPIVGVAEIDSPDVKESISRGKNLFQGLVAACAFCHGPEATGDGQQNNYDDWTRDWTSLAGLNPKDENELEPMLELGALPPRNILPRNLRLGVFRGGGSPQDLYTRIVNGIEGTPMPMAPLKPDNPQGLSQDDVWDLVNYLLSLNASYSSDSAVTNSAVTNSAEPISSAPERSTSENSDSVGGGTND